MLQTAAADIARLPRMAMEILWFSLLSALFVYHSTRQRVNRQHLNYNWKLETNEVILIHRTDVMKGALQNQKISEERAMGPLRKGLIPVTLSIQLAFADFALGFLSVIFHCCF